MSGAGRKPVVGTYRTPRTPYRTVSAVDASIDAVTEVIDTREDASVNDSPTTTGIDSTLALYVLLDTVTAATLQLYARATDESAENPVSSSSPGGVSSWVFHSEFTVDSKGLLHVVIDLPADQYKVMVTNITGAGEVSILETHSL